MGYFDSKQNVEDYIRIAEGYDGRKLIQRLKAHLPKESSVLELGMGPGTDLELLGENYKVTGSDSSKVFVERYAGLHPDADVLVLDAVNIDTPKQFDAIYSNKVLQHLTITEMTASLKAQHRTLNSGGMALHSLWRGDQCEAFGEMISQQYTLESFSDLIENQFKIVESWTYTEMEENDSLGVIIGRI